MKKIILLFILLPLVGNSYAQYAISIVGKKVVIDNNEYIMCEIYNKNPYQIIILNEGYRDNNIEVNELQSYAQIIGYKSFQSETINEKIGETSKLSFSCGTGAIKYHSILKYNIALGEWFRIYGNNATEPCIVFPISYKGLIKKFRIRVFLTYYCEIPKNNGSVESKLIQKEYYSNVIDNE